MKLYLIDCMAYVHRAFYALPPLTRKDGLPVGAIHGFMDMMLPVMDAGEHTHIAAVMDAGRSGREQILDDYKGQRSERPDDLVRQFPLVDRACEALGLPILRIKPYEADDVIAMFATHCENLGGEVRIFSSDKDLAQLVTDKIAMFDPMKKQTIGPDDVRARWGVDPHLIPDYLGLVGDAVDNIPGVPSVGPKTAAKLIQAHGDLEAIIAACRAGRAAATPRIAGLVCEHQDTARRSKEAATLIREMGTGLEPDLSAIIGKPRDYRLALDFCEEMEFEQIAERLMATA